MTMARPVYSLVELALWAICVSHTTAQFVLYPYSDQSGAVGNRIDNVDGFGNITVLSPGCGHALNATIGCHDTLKTLAALNAYASLGGQGPSICNPSCGASLATYHSSVVANCGDVGAFAGVPNAWAGDAIWSFYNRTCSIDTSSGLYCSDVLPSQYKLLVGSNSSSVSSIPLSFLCSYCSISTWVGMQASAYSGYDAVLAETWIDIQHACGISEPSTPSAITFNVSVGYQPPYAPAVSMPCVSNQTYTILPGDTCSSLANKTSVSSGTLQIINDLLPDCSNLANDQKLCLPKTCETYVVATTDTCLSIASAHGIPLNMLISYNPDINAACSNLVPRSVICLTPAVGSFTPIAISGAASALTATYATQAKAPPGLVAYGTTLACGSWYKVQTKDYCSIISISTGVGLSLLYSINPSINSDCSNLKPGLYYCVQPTIDWNATSTSNVTGPSTTTPVTAPTPTSSGGASICYQWHIVAANETCDYITSAYAITLNQVIAWNPAIDARCTNLLPGLAYCVSSPLTAPVPSSSSGSTAASTVTPISTAPPGPASSVSSCAQTYTVQPGDYCYEIYTQFGHTETQFLALNPSLTPTCVIQAGQVLCV